MTTPEALEPFLDAARRQVDEALDRFLPRPPECPALLSNAMQYSVFAGGKRLRPCLALAAADAVARHDSSGRETISAEAAARLTLPAACAIELIHTYSLIHDDLPAMDNDTMRRGRPTLHVVYGDGVAILVGDGLQAEAFALLAREPTGTEAHLVARKLRVVLTVANAARTIGLVGGQATDLQAAGQAPGHDVRLDREGLQRMHAQKTGALIRAAAACGAIMAGADQLVDVIDRYAADLGLAFQIVDDILDVEGSAGQLGKTAGKDASGAKPTYPALYGLGRSHALASECIARAKQTLADASITRGWLGPIADWVVSRKH